MQELLSAPLYWLFLITCASSDYLKLVPLFVLYLLDGTNDYFEFTGLVIGDLFFLMVMSFDNYIALNIGVFAFLIFVWSRIIKEISSFSLRQKWPIPVFSSLAFLLITLHPIEEYLLQIYVWSLASLLTLRYCQDDKQLITMGYSLYVISDCLLLFSLNFRFPLDWVLVRLLYWLGLTLIY